MSPLSRCRVLLAEDEALVAMELTMDLEDAGADVIAVTNLNAALDAIGTGEDVPFDAALLDVNLNDRDVFPAARLLDGRGVPIVFHTGHAKPEDIARDFPAATTLTKPVQSHAIIRALADSIEGTARH